MMSRFVQAQAPGKLIVLGEHAVVKGSPALALALKRYTKAHIALKSEHQSIFFSSEFISSGKKWGPCLIEPTDCLDDCFQWAREMALEIFSEKKREGIEWKLESEIEPGHGMGSSAAAITASFMALTTLLDNSMAKEKYWPFLTKIESICHGKSSGIDIAVSLKGGCIQFQKGEFRSLKTPDVSNWYFFDSGKPFEKTRECVAHTQKRFEESPDLFYQMDRLALDFIHSVASLSFEEISSVIRKWHRLQVCLGVVTKKVIQFIDWIESLGASAKVCGAGALSEEGSGLILILAAPHVYEKIREKKIALEPVEVDHEGARVILLG